MKAVSSNLNYMRIQHLNSLGDNWLKTDFIYDGISNIKLDPNPTKYSFLNGGVKFESIED